ncbi:ABC transporter permease subunit [Kosmotoga pacifica]|uniref:ABC transporter permease n=1 Tax=Kosmotoga pacifica TaxID=1330330 RepID=A0A0G2ZD13_9BACT|nr:ABC transporter permease subunit [Kosmotoga pacifica]AKI96698.1 ABC transporter permease [Kosmotoga pacifica]
MSVILYTIISIAIITIFIIFKRDALMSLPVFLLVLLVTLLPIGWAIFLSFFDLSAGGEADFVGGIYFQQVFADDGFKLSIRITSLWAFLKVSLEFIVSFYLALLLKETGKIGKFLLLMLGIGWFVPSYISVNAWRAMLLFIGRYLEHFGFGFNISLQPMAAFIASIIVNVLLSIPLTTFIIIAMLRNVPREIGDILAIDGCEDSIRASVYFGQIRYALIPFYFFQYVRAFKGFSTIYLLTGSGPIVPGGFTPRTLVGSTSTLGIVLYQKFSLYENYGMLSAYSLVTGIFLMIWILVAFISRFRVPARHRLVLIIASGVHIMSAFYLKWNIHLFTLSLLYFLLIWLIPYYKRVFRVLAILVMAYDAGFFLLQLLRYGWSGIEPSTLISLPALLLSLRYRLPVPNFSVPVLLKQSFKFLIPFISLFLLTYVVLLGLSVDNTPYPSGKWTLANLEKVFFVQKIWKNLFNTLWIAILSSTILFISIVPFSYVYTRSRKPLIKVVGVVILFGSIYAGMHTLLPLYEIFDRLKLTDTIFGVSLIVANQSLPIAFVVLSGFFSSIPREFREVAQLEGVGEYHYFRKVIVPLGLPVIFSVIIYNVVNAWNSFTIPLLFIESARLMPLSLKLFNYAGEIGSYYTKWNLFGAASIIGIIPVLFLFRYSERFLYARFLGEGGINYEQHF